MQYHIVILIRRQNWSLNWWTWGASGVKERSGSSALTMSLQVQIFNSMSNMPLILITPIFFGTFLSWSVIFCSPLCHLPERLQPDVIWGRHYEQNEGEPEALRRDPELNLLPENPLHRLLQQGRPLPGEAEEPHTGRLSPRLWGTKWLWASTVRICQHPPFTYFS